eukprot:4604979-Pleurochrysis_carterae.AAC.6
MTPHAAPPYSDSPTRRATAATASPAAGCWDASRASDVSVISGSATTASTAQARAATGDPLIDSSVTVEPAGRYRSVLGAGPPSFVAEPRRADAFAITWSTLFAASTQSLGRPAPRRLCPPCVAQPVLRDQLRLQPRARGDEGGELVEPPGCIAKRHGQTALPIQLPLQRRQHLRDRQAQLADRPQLVEREVGARLTTPRPRPRAIRWPCLGAECSQRRLEKVRGSAPKSSAFPLLVMCGMLINLIHNCIEHCELDNEPSAGGRTHESHGLVLNDGNRMQ